MPQPFFSSLSLSNDPPIHSVNPIFGQTSLHPAIDATDTSEPMDWEPAPSAVIYNGGWTHRPPPAWQHNEVVAQKQSARAKSDWDTFAVNKQRMYPTQPLTDETGLESLLAGWGIGTGGVPSGADTSNGQTPMGRNGMGVQMQDGAMRPESGLKIFDLRYFDMIRWVLIVIRLGGVITLLLDRYTTFTPWPMAYALVYGNGRGSTHLLVLSLEAAIIIVDILASIDNLASATRVRHGQEGGPVGSVGRIEREPRRWEMYHKMGCLGAVGALGFLGAIGGDGSRGLRVWGLSVLVDSLAMLKG
jgi:hypothetical protein